MAENRFVIAPATAGGQPVPPLFWATFANRPTFIQALLALGAERHEVYPIGKGMAKITARDMALLSHTKECVALLPRPPQRFSADVACVVM